MPAPGRGRVGLCVGGVGMAGLWVGWGWRVGSRAGHRCQAQPRPKHPTPPHPTQATCTRKHTTERMTHHKTNAQRPQAPPPTHTHPPTLDEDVLQVPAVGDVGGDDAVLGQRDHGAVIEHSQQHDEDGGEVPAGRGRGGGGEGRQQGPLVLRLQLLGPARRLRSRTPGPAGKMSSSARRPFFPSPLSQTRAGKRKSWGPPNPPAPLPCQKRTSCR